MMRRTLSLIVALLIVVVGSNAFAGAIKMALIAPEGSTWINVMKEMSAELKSKTGGRWQLQLYPGGVSGDEKVVIKKMKIGQLDAAGFTGVGLGEIYPAVRVLELPFLFNNSKEVDYVVGKLLPDLKSGFIGKGFQFLGWAESGFVHIFSNKAIKKLGDMKGVKMWMWQGDPLAEKMFETFKIVPVPLPVPDVLMALQTKMIDAVYAPPLAAIAMQWFSKTRYMSDAKMVNAIGAILITNRAYNKMTPADKTVLKQLSEKYTKKLVQLTRKDNEKSLETLKAAGIQFVPMDAANLKVIEEKSKTVWTAMVGKLYPQALLGKVVKYLAEYRGKN